MPAWLAADGAGSGSWWPGDLAGGQCPPGDRRPPRGWRPRASVAAGFLDGGGGQAQAEGDVGGAEQEQGRAQPYAAAR